MLGLPVANLTLLEAAQLILDQVQGRQDPCWQVVTLNPEMVLTARQDQAFAAIITNADLVVPDGVGVFWASRVLGNPLPETVPGIDLVQHLLAVGEQHLGRPLRVYLLGSQPGVAETAAQQIKVQYPGSSIVGFQHGYFPLAASDEIIAEINAARADLLLVGLGSPRQERWIAEHRNFLQPPVAIGVGGVFDVLAGHVQRAPLWVRRLRLEWLWRALQEPARFRRLLGLPKFVIMVYASKYRGKKR